MNFIVVYQQPLQSISTTFSTIKNVKCITTTLKSIITKKIKGVPKIYQFCFCLSLGFRQSWNRKLPKAMSWNHQNDCIINQEKGKNKIGKFLGTPFISCEVATTTENRKRIIWHTSLWKQWSEDHDGDEWQWLILSLDPSPELSA